MKRLRYLLIIFITFFFCNAVIDAGVCDGKVKDLESSYCNLGISYRYPEKSNTDLYKNRYFFNSDSEGYLGYAYEATLGTFSGSNEYAFCLDPGKFDPSLDYNFGRELEIDFSDDEEKITYDESIYKTYQYYINDVISAKVSNSYDEKIKQKYLAYADILFRVYTAAYGYDLDVDKVAPYYYYSILPYIIGDNRVELTNQIGSVVNDLYNNPNITGDCKLTDSNLSKFSSCGKDWASSTDELDGVKNHFNRVFDGGILWKNPLTITPTVETDSNGNYIYSFKVEFSKDGYNYFGGTYDYDIGYGKAFFEFVDFEVNGVKYDSSFGTKIVPANNIINADSVANANETVTYQLSISPDRYEQFESVGKVDVKMVYKTYHPMSDENVFVNYHNNRKSDSESLYQRMIVFTKYAGEKRTGIDKNTYTCKQDNDIFKVNDVEKTLEEYIASCGCRMVDYNSLSEDNKTIFVNAGCIKTSITVTSDLEKCVGNVDDYKIEYKEEREINDYCDLTCIETVNINNLLIENKLSVRAGEYFKLPQYPELIGKKNCTVKVDYQKWKNTYKSLLSDLVSKYNIKEKFRKAIHFSLYDSSDKSKNCSKGICYYYYLTDYDGANLSGTYIYSEEESYDFMLHACCGTTDADALRAKNYEEASDDYEEVIEKLNKHLKKLNTCTTTIENMGLPKEEYYTFNKEMNFYYQQEYSNNSYGLRYNNERPNSMNDSELVFDSFSYSDVGVYDPEDATDDYYDHIESGRGYNDTAVHDDNGRTQYYRVVTYTYDDSRSNIFKYTDSYTAKISSENTSLKNPIKLGYVYDIDASAKAKDYPNYYKFTSLGDENKIYNHFAQGKLVNGVASSLSGLERYCEYKVTNELMETGGESTKLNIVYRVVDPNNIDPNNRLGTDAGFKNWNNDKGKVVLDALKNEDTFNPDNLEYSFELNSATLKEIRKFNEGEKYSDFNLDCNDEGNECISDFIKDAYNGSGLIFDKPFATNVTGSDNWKYMNYNESTGKWGIKLYNREDMTDTMFESLTEKLGGITP